MESSFGALLRGYRERAGLAQNGLARVSGVNVGTVNRLERGQRLPAGREQALALARTLGLDPSETNRLLAAAGLPAEGFGPEITSHPTIRALVDLLQDEAIPRTDREDLLATLERYVQLVTRANGRSIGGNDAA
ncbi:MAG: helix-turn-helix transcriptional regulator [Chloroflexota bacterium]